mmetsp:Transcript_30817/g.50905  ORF Transcript_30817/g.50905 Transcript_30817/m.50905 type:complete len:130 (-) Transcript_30817:111-500(-)
MKFVAFIACLLLGYASAFAPSSAHVRHSVALEAKKAAPSFGERSAAIAAGAILSSQFLIQAAGASDIPIADLPPTYVPVGIGVLLLGGVGLLTSSLGDIMSEESSLGLQSGARAKKEMERSKSSYFKKR